MPPSGGTLVPAVGLCQLGRDESGAARVLIASRSAGRCWCGDGWLRGPKGARSYFVLPRSGAFFVPLAGYPPGEANGYMSLYVLIYMYGVVFQPGS